MIKVIVFDLDGVLVNTRELHYETLNMALEPYGYKIELDEHLTKYDGYPTGYKLSLLTKEKGLPVSFHDKIWRRKQELTQTMLSKFLKPDPEIISTLKRLSQDGYKIYVASNSIWATIKNSLLHSGLMEHVDYFVSCEEVKHPKPSPEIYLRCFQHANVGPSEVLVCEDSPVGIKSASGSMAHLLPVGKKEDISYENITQKINSIVFKTTDVIPQVKMNIVIPMAGHGSRFSAAGYTMPKPLIDVKGKAMIQRVVENIGIKARFIFIVQEEHYNKYYLQILLNAIAPGCVIIPIKGVTEGAACSVLTAKEHIDNDAHLVIANSDQYLEWNPYEFLYCSMSPGVDGCISTFESSHPKFSYAKLGENGYVNEVAEKVVISNSATTGIYFWKKGSDFVKHAEEMIAKNIRVNNEFYVAPVFNQAIESGKKIKVVECKGFHCLGTPEDLEGFLEKDVV